MTHPRALHPAAALPVSAHALAQRAELPSGRGRGQLLFFDAQSGAAGDMINAALLDLGVPLGVVQAAVDALGLRGVRLHVSRGFVQAIGATRFEVLVEEPQPARSHAVIDRLLSESSLGPEVKRLARAVFQRLAEAEAQVHRVPVAEVHFHEVGGVDALVDIVGAVASLAHLEARVVVSPLPLGRGVVRCQHGVLPLPAPATLLCLRGVPTYDAGIEGELVTPTGAALLATVAQRFERWPSFAVDAVGWGAGSRALPDRPNALRVVLGDSTAPAAVEPPLVVLEANVDDLTGEVASYTLQRLLAEGALDAWATPIVMKKGRPALTVSALSTQTARERVARCLLAETSSLGVRTYEVTRITRPRRIVLVQTPYGTVPVKISEGEYGPPQAKPEYEVCAQLAAEHGVPLRQILSAALAALPPE